MPTDLPAAAAFTGASVTEGDFKTAITELRAFLSELLGDNSGTSAQIVAPVGSVTEPGITVAGDLDCGIYRIGANNLGFSVNATKILDIATTGLTVTGTISGTLASAVVATTQTAADNSTKVSTTAYADTAANNAARGKQTVWIPAAAFVPRTTNGAAPGTTESATNKVMSKTLDFDTTTSEGAQFMIAMPKSWNESTVTFVPIWTAASGSGTVIWGLRGVALSNDDAIDTAFGTAQTSTDTLLAALDQHTGPESSAITIGGTPAENDLVVFEIYRDVADTLGVDAKLIGIKLHFTTNANDDT